jgi:nitrate reductase gamma subunit
MRLFLDPVPAWIGWWEFIDGIFEVGAPTWYMSDVGLVLGCLLLFSRRLITRHVRYISLMNDYFPLVLIFAVAITGILMRFFLRTDIDIVNIKQLTVGLVTLSPTIGAEIGSIFYIHVFLVCVLLAYFPFSKLMHFAGVFLSPTRNLKNDSRAVRHENPWNPRILPHSYSGYEDEFREFMVDAGIPVEKELSPAKDE